MLGIGTNVLVRFLVRDDPEQFERARRLIKRELGGGETVLISLLVLLETEWVLRSRYNVAKAEIVAAIRAFGPAVSVAPGRNSRNSPFDERLGPPDSQSSPIASRTTPAP